MSEAGTETKPRGVYRTSYGNRWFAQIRRGGKLHYLGTFATQDEASEAVERVADFFAENPSIQF
jgi:hypothetical protein